MGHAEIHGQWPMVEEINIRSGEADVADTNERKESHARTSRECGSADRVCERESPAEVRSSLLSWLWYPLLVGCAEEAEAGISGVEGERAWPHLCVRVPAALPEEQSLVPRIPADSFTTSCNSRSFQGSPCPLLFSGRGNNCICVCACVGPSTRSIP